MTRRSPLRSLLPRGLVVLAAAAAVCVAGLPDPSRPVLVAGGLTVAGALAAAVTAWRPAGTVALGLATLTVLVAGALDASAVRPVQAVGAGALLLAMVAALDRAESTADPTGQPPVTVLRAPAARWLAPLALSVGAAALVAFTASRSVVPSVGLVLVGLAAAVAASVLASRAHRR